MPSYPIEPEKLLEVAERLAPAQPGRGRPSYTAHRRAVSTAYYAVFHALTDRVAKVVFGEADQAFRQKVQRWIGHGNIRTVALWVSQLQGDSSGSPPPHIAELLGPIEGAAQIDEATIAMADGFLELNEKREEADYDHEAIFTRPDTRGHIALARDVVSTIEQADSDSAKRFFGLIAMQSKIQTR